MKTLCLLPILFMVLGANTAAQKQPQERLP